MKSYKHKLFKKFYELDFNEYYTAEIGGELYFGVGTLFYYVKQGWFGLEKKCVEEQNFATIKIPPMLALFFGFLLERQLAEDKTQLWLIEDVVKKTREQVIAEVVAMEESAIEAKPAHKREISKLFKKDYERLDENFYLDWNNALINDYLDKGWTFVFKEYAGRATRNIYLVRTESDLITVLSIKLFGNADDNEVVDYKRVLMNNDILNAYVNTINEDAKTSKGAK